MNVIYKVYFLNCPYFLYGSTNNFSRRKNQYLYKLRKNKYENDFLQKVFNKYGEENLKIEVVRNNIPIEILRDVENIWIGANCSRADDKMKGMNLIDAIIPRFSQETLNKLKECRKGEKNHFYGKKHTEEFKINQSLRLKGKKQKVKSVKVLQYGLDGKLIMIFNHYRDAANILGIFYKSINHALYSKSHFAGNYIWLPYTENFLEEIEVKIRRTLDEKKPVLQYDLQDNFIQEFDSPKEAAKYLGLSYASEISKAALDKIKKAHNYKWVYKFK